MERSIIYYETTGQSNTNLTLSLAVEAATKRGIETIVAASRTGATAASLMERIKDTDIRLVVVTPQYGWQDEHEFDRSLIPQLRQAGNDFCSGAMPFHTNAFHGCPAPKRMGDILRIFSDGVQVCIEIALMAADSGLIECGQHCVLIAGTQRGADTAIIASPSSSARLEDFRVHEILCKPYMTPE